MDKFAIVSEEVISCCMRHLKQRGVHLEGCLLKLQMVIPGAECTAVKPAPEKIAQQTFDLMQRSDCVQHCVLQYLLVQVFMLLKCGIFILGISIASFAALKSCAALLGKQIT